jgi:chromosome segregation ATPase
MGFEIPHQENRLTRVEVNQEHIIRAIDQITALAKATADREQALANRARDADLEIRQLREEVTALEEKIKENEEHQIDFTKWLKLAKTAIIVMRWAIFVVMAGSFLIGNMPAFEKLKSLVGMLPH